MKSGSGSWGAVVRTTNKERKGTDSDSSTTEMVLTIFTFVGYRITAARKEIQFTEVHTHREGTWGKSLANTCAKVSLSPSESEGKRDKYVALFTLSLFFPFFLCSSSQTHALLPSHSIPNSILTMCKSRPSADSLIKDRQSTSSREVFLKDYMDET